NIVIFGETGVGKSSIINILVQQGLAETSDGALGCTSGFKCCPAEISGQRFVLFDTAGTVPAAMAEKQLKSLLGELMSPESDGIGLLVYCMRSTSALHALARVYNMFYAGICQKRVPIVVIITGLERKARMEDWWDTNEKFKSHGMQFAGHARVTA
ncbi:P-loop containing nucleoside triphosphate hydrolase protein, partial [Suillus subaureus]